MNSEPLNIAILIPALNEEKTIVSVITQFNQFLPEAKVYVYDNNSNDNTLLLARQAGAITRLVRNKGKGNVIYRLFADIDADIYVLIDADDTYDVSQCEELIQCLVENKCDMVVGIRVPESKTTFPEGHELGNKLFNYILSWLFGERVIDMFSGYRVLSRRFVKTMPLTSTGFEIETEMTVYSLQTRLAFREIPTTYRERMQGSSSKLRTLYDGQRIAMKIVSMVESERPLFFYGLISIVLALLSVVLSIPLFTTFLETGLVPRIPTAILCASLMVIALIALACGLIGRSTTKLKSELRRLVYLMYEEKR